MQTLFAFIIIFNGHALVEDSGLTAADCAARVVEYSQQVAATFVCELEIEQ